MQLLRLAQGRPNGQGRPFYNGLRQRGAASPNFDHHVQHQIFRDVATLYNS